MPVPTPPFTIDWGDGTVSTNIPHVALSHDYARVSDSPDTYKVTVTDAAGRRGTTTIYVVMQPFIDNHYPYSLDSNTTSSYVTVTLYGRNFSPNVQYSLNGSDTWQIPARIREADGSTRTTELAFNVPVSLFNSGQTEVSVVLRAEGEDEIPTYTYSTAYTIGVDTPAPDPFDDSFDYSFHPPTLLPASIPLASVPDTTVPNVKAWVGEDAFRASVALEAELHRTHPRQTLVTYLDAMIKGTP